MALFTVVLNQLAGYLSHLSTFKGQTFVEAPPVPNIINWWEKMGGGMAYCQATQHHFWLCSQKPHCYIVRPIF